MKEMKRVLAIFLCLVMLVGVLPVNALAEETAQGTGLLTSAASSDVMNRTGESTEEAAGDEGTVTSDDGTATPDDGTATPDDGTATPDDGTATPDDGTATPDDGTATPDDGTATPDDGTATPDDGTATPDDGTATPDDGADEESDLLTTASADDGIDAQAEDGVIYVLAGSDFQPTDASNTTGVNLLNAILDKVDDKYTTMDGFLFAGDYDYNYSASQSSKEALQAAVQAVYGTAMDEIYVQGNHDSDSLVGSVLTSSGNNDTENYGVFVINEKDYMWYNDDETTIKNTASSLETYLNAKRNAGYTKPIFVMSHLPLHYCMRTQVGGGDGKHANYIFDVLNEAGEAGLNIIFLFGHNHSHGWDDPYGGAAIFLKKGDSINIAQNSTTNYNVETLAFTYMNAGYVSYYRNVNSGAETDLSMTVFAITDSDVTIERYTADGLHDLKSAGVANTHASTGSSVDGSCSTNHGGTETYDPDTSTVASAYTLTLNTEITPAGTEVVAPDTDSGSTSNQRTYTRVTSIDELVSGGQYLIIENGSTDYFMLPESTSNDAGDRVGYAIESTSVAGGDTITGDYSAKEWTMTGSGSSWVLSTSAGSAYMEYQSSSRAYGRISSTNSSTFTIGGSADAFTFTTTTNGYTYVFDHGSNALINGYVKDPEDVFYIYRMTDAGSGSTVDTTGGSWVTITEPTEAGTRYVYELDTDGVDTGVEYLIVANSYPKALSAAASSNNAVDITISGNYAYASSDTYGWTFTRYSNGVYYIRLNNSTYLRLNSGSLGSSNSTGNDRRWTVSSNGDGSYDIVRNNYNLRWSNSGGVFEADSSAEGPVRLYKYVKTETTTAQSGLYGKISGELTYNVAIGTSAEDALAAVKAGIDILYHTGDESAAQTFPDDGEGMTWTLDPSYDGTTPGEYAVTIAYNGVTLGTAKVVVPAVAIDSYSVNPMVGTVTQGAAQNVATGSTITVTLEGGDYYTVPVTVSMLSKDGTAVTTADATTLTGLTVTYNGVAVATNYTLNIVPKTVNNYPEYPNEGAVKVNKTATGIEFQKTGVARVELSASGVPTRKGADVVVVIDTSSSMKDNNIGSKTRIEVLSESLEQMLTQFKTAGEDGQAPDISIAIIDFNGYFPNAREAVDQISFTGTSRDNADYAQVFTGTNAGGYIKNVGLSADNFVAATTLNAATVAGYFTNDNCASGTNYDGALKNAYDLLTAKKAANGDEDRDQYVIFLSDGAPFRYNGFNNGSTKSTYNAWSNWLEGIWETEAAFKEDYPNQNYSAYYNGNGTNHPHRYAEAIKGIEGELYTVVSRESTDMYTVNGLGATIYSIGFGLADDGSDSEGGKVSVATQQELIQVISSGSGYYYDNVQDADELTSAFTKIVTDIRYAAYNARFTDTMGEHYNIQLKPTVTTADGETYTLAEVPQMEVRSYTIWTRAEYEAGSCSLDQIGDRKTDSDGNYIYTVLETVTFNEDGTEAYTGGDTSNNILIDGVICADTFWYNTTAETVKIDVDGDGTAEYDLPAETFYWSIGNIITNELALSYYVHLDGSMSGKEAGSYATNESAVLYYDNYLGNACQKATVSPVMAWEAANVSYAFYLVNKDGQPVNMDGTVVTFANRVTVVNPTYYGEILFNDIEVGSVGALEIVADNPEILPGVYSLYDYAAQYKVQVKSDGVGSWTITQGTDVNASTYVTDFSDTIPYSKELSADTTTYDYTHTTVWFAVVWEPKALPDTVVIDYGLPVDIHVMTNDMFGNFGRLIGITEGDVTATASKTTNSVPEEEASGTYGQAKVIVPETNAGEGNSVVRYTLNTSNGMQMQVPEVFTYSVQYTNTLVTTNNGYYYGTVTVIPATTIYYEDEFVELSVFTKDADGNWVEGTESGWTTDTDSSDDANAGITQDEDRPDDINYAFDTVIDANNVYGYDSAYKTMSKYSLGSAAKVNVTAGKYATAKFDFYGTGFDIISLTDNTTGTIVVKVYADGSTEPYVMETVDTYYGYARQYWNVTYTYTDGEWTATDETQVDAMDTVNEAPADPAEGDTYTTCEIKWVTTTNAPNALYQVPVMKIGDGQTTEELPYGKYTAEITVSYIPFLDDTTADGYDFYLDAIRIYNPTGNQNDTANDAYQADGEGWPAYYEVRDKIIDLNTFNSLEDGDTITGAVFIDGATTSGAGTAASVADYESYGPNNELYLEPGDAVSFTMNATATAGKVAKVQLAVKTVGGTGKVEVYGVDADGTTTACLSETISTATDMYYDITALNGKTVVIKNSGADTDAIISITNVKVTYTEEQVTAPAAVFSLRRSAVDAAVASLNEVEEETVPETTVPEETEPNESVPETTVPEETEPEETTPETTVPEETEPEETEPEETEPEQTKPSTQEKIEKAVETVRKIAKKLFGWLFG